MPVVVDNQPLSTESLGLRTFGQVLAHLQRENRLVVHVLIDGQEPDLSAAQQLRQTPTEPHTIYVETTEPRTMANEVLDEVLLQVDHADALRAETVELLRTEAHGKAFEKLSGCFTCWQATHESVQKVAQLLRIDMDRLSVDGEPLAALLARFSGQLRTIRQAIEDRDFVTLADTLAYELPESSQRWRAAVEAIRRVLD